MVFKKSKDIVLLVLIITMSYINNAAFADQILLPESKMPDNLQVNINNSLQTTINIVDTDTNIKTDIDKTAVDIKSDKDKEENIVPILDLKGGVQEQEVKKETPFKIWINEDNATGDWNGLRPKLEKHGITFSGCYMSDSFQKLHGGISGKNPLRTFGVVDTSLTLDTKKIGLWQGGKLLARFQNKHGLGLSRDYIGDFQGMDAYDYRKFAQLSEYWYEQNLLGDKIRVKLGKQDSNYDFLVSNTGQNFINNSTAYYMPTIPLPTYPDPAIGAMIAVKPFDWLSLKSGIYDGDAKGGTSGFDTAFSGNDSAFLIEEVGISHNINNHPGNYLAGYWLKTKNTDELTNADDPRIFSKTTGWYMECEQMIWKENKDNTDDQGLTILGQFSWSPSDRKEIARYYGTGLSYKGLISHRDKDIIGIATAIAKFSGRLKDIEDDGRYGSESILEMFYKIQLTPWLALQPDMQFVFHPNGQNKNAFVMGLRTSINF